MAVVEAVERQLEATWKQWLKAIDDIPVEHWRTGPVDYLIPARHSLHVINTVEGYCREEQPASWNGLLAAHFGRELDWEGTPAAELPDQQEQRGYLEAVRGKVRQWLQDKEDADLLAPQQAFPWTGPNLLSRLIYVIRNSQDHTGQLNAELRRRGLPRSTWEC